jgi:hypothetical protein
MTAELKRFMCDFIDPLGVRRMIFWDRRDQAHPLSTGSYGTPATVSSSSCKKQWKVLVSSIRNDEW